jgi:hypothetical protein
MISGLFIIPVVIGMTQFRQESTTQNYVNRLGKEGSRAIIEQHLVKNPSVAIDLIIKSLHPIERTGEISIDDIEARSLIWKIRALSYLSGKKMYGHVDALTYKKLCKEQPDFLSIEGISKDHIPLFFCWRSRGTLLLAPREAQNEILKKWEKWSATKDGMKISNDLNFWYD